jgi:hypothetical protein
MGVGGQRHAPAALTSGKRPGTYIIGDCDVPTAGKSCPHRDSIPGLSSL